MRHKILNFSVFLTLACLVLQACSKVEYRELNEPAYLRVFNSLNYEIRVENRTELQPFLTMLIDPEFDADGAPIGGKIVGDHLDQRLSYAPPYPSHSSTGTSFRNPEYPGKANVLVAPVLNGFDLSSWAQVPSGEHRIMFLFRPVSEVPFAQLEQRLRRNIILDTVIRLDAREVYTLHVLQKDFETKENGIILRQENFHKQPFSDQRVYFNVYNMSAKGFLEADNRLKPENVGGGNLRWGMEDQVDIYLTLNKQLDSYFSFTPASSLPGYFNRYVGSVRRNAESSHISPYFSFPLFADPNSDGISTSCIQALILTAAGLNPSHPPGPINNTFDSQGKYIPLVFHGKIPDVTVAGFLSAAPFPNMIVSEHSGEYNPRSFATVNTIEIINGRAYLMTVQRKYAPPIFNKD